MGFLHQQQVRLAARLLAWQYQRMNLPVPPADEIKRQAEAIVKEAHGIARTSGRNFMGILKDMIADLKKQ